jgi:hypothetical protein
MLPTCVTAFWSISRSRSGAAAGRRPHGIRELIWQGDACAQALECLPRCAAPQWSPHHGPECFDPRGTGLADLERAPQVVESSNERLVE